jgi:hypothetical protein
MRAADGRAVYGYCGRLFREHPYRERAGLTGMIGPALHGPDQVCADRPGPRPGAALPPEFVILDSGL